MLAERYFEEGFALLKRLQAELRTQHYSLLTEQAYKSWVGRFLSLMI